MSTLDRDDASHLMDVLDPEPTRQRFEVATIKLLVEQGGETTIIPETMKPLSILLLRQMVSKGLVTADLTSQLELNPRTRLRLTDHGRQIATYLETMDKNRKVVHAESINLPT